MIRPAPPSRNLTELDRDQFRALMSELSEPSYRADQLYAWIFQRGARAFDEMTNLPKALRQRLVSEGYTVGRVSLGRVADSLDGTRKIAMRLDDGAAVETVLIPMGDGELTQCLSTQVGCAMGCAFCYTGTLGLSRNLTAGEIVDQVLLARRNLPEGTRINHIVYMGMGEPLHNLDAVVRSIECLADPEGLGYSMRRITVSTSGLVPQIEKLGDRLPVNLAVSLNGTTDAQRDVIMPVNRRYPIARLMAALRAFPLAARRRITIEYVLLGGTNDSDEDARRLAKLLAGMDVRINLLPWNPFAGPGFARPADERVAAFKTVLERRGHTVTVRTTKGLDIDAACGQLGERPTAE